jgi:hypothetical protein
MPTEGRADNGIGLTSVDWPQQAEMGFRLTSPPVGFPAIDRAAAEATALDQFPFATIVEAALVEMVGSHDRPPIRCVCWAVSLAPTPGRDFAPASGPHGMGPKPPTVFGFMVVFIDASTGKYIEAAEHSDFAMGDGTGST